jgi:hypothetical protein
MLKHILSEIKFNVHFYLTSFFLLDHLKIKLFSFLQITFYYKNAELGFYEIIKD